MSDDFVIESGSPPLEYVPMNRALRPPKEDEKTYERWASAQRVLKTRRLHIIALPAGVGRLPTHLTGRGDTAALTHEGDDKNSGARQHNDKQPQRDFPLLWMHGRESPRSVRFTPESGHVRCSYGCPLWANSGHRPITTRSLRRRTQLRSWNSNTEHLHVQTSSNLFACSIRRIFVARGCDLVKCHQG
jgi:hypothetical protein